MDTDTSSSTLEQWLTQLQAQVVAMATAQGDANATQKGFSDTPIFDSSKPKELRTWIIRLRNKLAVQPHHYPNDQACLRCTVNRLSGAALNLIRIYVSENTGQIWYESLKALLKLLHQAFNDPNTTCTANREIQKLKQKNGTFATYFTKVVWFMGDLNWSKEAQREQLYDGLSDEIKHALVTSHPRSYSL